MHVSVGFVMGADFAKTTTSPLIIPSVLVASKVGSRKLSTYSKGGLQGRPKLADDAHRTVL